MHVRFEVCIRKSLLRDDIATVHKPSVTVAKVTGLVACFYGKLTHRDKHERFISEPTLAAFGAPYNYHWVHRVQNFTVGIVAADIDCS